MSTTAKEAAMNAMHTAWIGGLGFIHINPKDLERIPAADVAPVVRSEWKNHDYDNVLCETYCPKCRFMPHIGNDYSVRDYNYCPNCGAKMDLKE